MPDSEGTWFISRSGRKWDVWMPTVEEVHWPDVAESLAKQCRFNGHCRGHYSVAQHSVYVADLLPPELHLYGLLHDAHEAWMGDIIRPVKVLLGETLKAVERDLDRIIYAAAHIEPPSDDIKAEIKQADLAMLGAERRDLIDLTSIHTEWVALERVPPADTKVVPIDWETARQVYLQELEYELGRIGALS